jgi:molecular chaperone HtpG
MKSSANKTAGGLFLKSQMPAIMEGVIGTVAKKQFKAESKRLLDLMINSIYTHKEIFLRELISNASDAMDKLYYQGLSGDTTGLNREDFVIRIEADKEQRLLTIRDNGVGMSREELESNLGTIARSGSLTFKNDSDPDKMEDIDIIGQFGVGFYSAFMVSDRISVVSRAFGSDEAWRWESAGTDGYSITTAEKDAPGTDIILHIKEKTADDNYDEFLESYRLKTLVKKYSDYIRYPIRMLVTKNRLKEGTDDYEEYTEEETLNSMVPLWRKNKSELTADDYNQYYKDIFHDYTDPLLYIHSNVEGVSAYDALLFVPGKKPYDYYSREYEKGLQLYSSGVLIMDKCADLLPDYFSFVKGLVDSQDLSLNISRELLQHDRQLKAIAAHIEKKIQSELLKLLAQDREKYETFFEQFGLQLKYGLYSDFGLHKDQLQDLILFYSSTQQKLTTFAEYVERMKEGQTYIYYASGESVSRIDCLPQTELLKEKGYEILYLTAEVDEFAVRVLREYGGKEFRSVSTGEDLGLEESEEEKQEAQRLSEENKELLTELKEALGDKVSEVRLSQRLLRHPVCLASGGELSLEMEKVLNAMPDSGGNIKAERILEINAAHPVLAALKRIREEDGGADKLPGYADLLYNQALLIEGLSIDDPVAFSNAICALMG